MSIKEDHNRFRDIIRGKIKQDFKRFVSQGEMIGKREKDFVKIPIPHIEIPTFRYGKKKESVKASSHSSLKDQWLLANESPDLQAHLAQVLVEIVVSAEAESFSIGQIDKEELERWQKHLQEQTQSWAPWKTFEVQQDELSGILNRKMRAKNFLKFKMEASGVTVSEDEVKQYYEKNRVKFGNMPSVSSEYSR